MKKLKLIHKNIIGILIIAIVICITCAIVGYRYSKDYIYSTSNETAYQVAEIIYQMFDERELHHYLELTQRYKHGSMGIQSLEKIAMTKDYQEILHQMKLIREKMELNDIYMAYLDKEELENYQEEKEWTPLVYVFDTYHIEEENYKIGEMGGLNPIYREEAIKIAETGKRSKNYFISKGEYGFNTSAIFPVVKDGKTLGVIGVEVPILEIRKSIAGYIQESVISLILVTGSIMAVYLWYLYRYMIQPIKSIKEELEHFKKEGNKAAEGLSYIKTGDEIEDLSREVIELEREITEYIEKLKRTIEEKEEIGKELNQINDIAFKDPLTGVKSMAAYQEAIEKINGYLKKGRVKFAVAMFDLNNLKIVNDTYGHEVGDKYIKNGCKLICSIFKSSPVFRIGGDEFLAILSGNDYNKREYLLSKLYKIMEEEQKPANPIEKKISLAAGIAEFREKQDKDFQDVFKRADALMYEKKKEMKKQMNN